MTVAERTREAVRSRPFLYDALAAGVVNYSAAAETLALDAETDAVTAALRRFGDELDEANFEPDARVTMRRGLSTINGVDTADAEPLLHIAGTSLHDDSGDLAAVVARGSVDALALERALGRLRTADVTVEVAGVGRDALVAAVPSRETAAAVRAVEDALTV
jgi:hypothetical protein